METAPIVTSRGPHHTAFAVGRVHVLVVARRKLGPAEVGSFFGARRSIEDLYPNGHVVIADLRSMEGLLDLETREVIAVHVRLQRAGHLRARAVVLPRDPDLAHVVRGFMVAYLQAPGVRCPDAFVWTLEDACAFVARYVAEGVDVGTIVEATSAARVELAAPTPAAT